MNNYCRNSLNTYNNSVGNASFLSNVSDTTTINTPNFTDTNTRLDINNCVNQTLLNTLCNYIGRRCTCDFDTSRGIESKTGILERIGNDYLTLRSVNSNKLMYCNTCSLKFVTICC